MDVRLSRHRTPSKSRRDLLPALLLLMAIGAACLPRVARAQGAGSDTLTLLWTAPGDDGLVGTATRYEVRSSTSPITDSNWYSATLVSGVPTPLPSGTRQSVVVRGLVFGMTYYFAIKAFDEVDNGAPLSNVVRWDWVLDTSPPAAPTGVSAAVENTDQARVRWTANSEPDLAGYTVYRKLPGAAFQPITAAGFSATQFLDTTIPAGTTQVWYQVTARDVSGNESARSATYSLAIGGTTTVAGFDLQSAYPNPSRVGTPVNLPLSLPSGAGSAELLVMDSGGRRIRTLTLSGQGGGSQDVIWDGRNDAGSLAAPGVYTAWLIAAGQRRSVKFVRQP